MSLVRDIYHKKTFILYKIPHVKLYIIYSNTKASIAIKIIIDLFEMECIKFEKKIHLKVGMYVNNYLKIYFLEYSHISNSL